MEGKNTVCEFRDNEIIPGIICPIAKGDYCIGRNCGGYNDMKAIRDNPAEFYRKRADCSIFG
jgi:hypothetical protein